jgi:hypothetical protein
MRRSVERYKMTHAEQALLFITLACSVDMSPIMRRAIGEQAARAGALALKWLLFMDAFLHLAACLDSVWP